MADSRSSGRAALWPPPASPPASGRNGQPADPPESLGDVFAIGERVGKYQVRKFLGRGAMSEVWKAYDTVAQCDVVLKVLPAELLYSTEAQERMQQAFGRVRRLQHQYICPVFDLLMHPRAGMYVVMRHVDGVTLRAYRQRYVELHGRLLLDEAARLLTPVARALDYAHQQGVVHRDIKPDNIMVARNGRDVQVIDFGLAAEIQTTLQWRESQENAICGSVPYLAPEIWNGKPPGPSSDQFSLGVVAYELLAGTRPFTGADLGVVRELVIRGVFAPLEDQSREVNDVLARALAGDPSRRHASCKAFLAALSAQCAGPAVAAAPPAARRPALSRRLAYAACLAIGLGAPATLATQTVWGWAKSRVQSAAPLPAEDARKQVTFLRQWASDLDFKLLMLQLAARTPEETRTGAEQEARLRPTRDDLQGLAEQMAAATGDCSPEVAAKLQSATTALLALAHEITPRFDNSAAVRERRSSLAELAQAMKQEAEQGAHRAVRDGLLQQGRHLERLIAELEQASSRWQDAVTPLLTNDDGRRIAATEDRALLFDQRYAAGRLSFPVETAPFRARLATLLAPYREVDPQRLAALPNVPATKEQLAALEQELRQAIAAARLPVEEILALVDPATKPAGMTLAEAPEYFRRRRQADEAQRLAMETKAHREKLFQDELAAEKEWLAKLQTRPYVLPTVMKNAGGELPPGWQSPDGSVVLRSDRGRPGLQPLLERRDGGLVRWNELGTERALFFEGTIDWGSEGAGQGLEIALEAIRGRPLSLRLTQGTWFKDPVGYKYSWKFWLNGKSNVAPVNLPEVPLRFRVEQRDGQVKLWILDQEILAADADAEARYGSVKVQFVGSQHRLSEFKAGPLTSGKK